MKMKMKMKNIFKLSFILILFTAVSCDLDKYPFDQIEQSQAFQTVDDAAALRNGLYANLRGRLHGIYTFSTDVQADMLNATLDYGNRNGAPHKWTPFLADDYTIRDTWYGYYSALVNVNNMIENIGEIETESSDEDALLNQYLGEAYLLRAYYYHELVKRFAKDYDPGSASTDLGVPLILTFDVTLLPERATIEVVYQQIISDINEAKTLLADVAGEQDAGRLTIDAATALEARVKLHMHDFTGAATAANSLINSSTYELINNEEDFQNMWEFDVSSEVIFQFPKSAPNELGNANNIYLRYSPDLDAFQPDFIPQQWVVDMYEESDIRKGAYLEEKLVYIQGAYYENVYCVNKYPGNPELFTGANSNYQHKPKVFRLAEMYLISAEAQAQEGGNDAAALGVLNDLRVARGVEPFGNLSGNALMEAIKAERNRELLFEGTRLDDLKRWNMGFERKTPQNMDLIITGADFNQKEVPADHPKFVWGIPQNDITTNPNIADQQNPGW